MNVSLTNQPQIDWASLSAQVSGGAQFQNPLRLQLIPNLYLRRLFIAYYIQTTPAQVQQRFKLNLNLNGMTVFEMIIHGPQGIGASRVDGDLNISNVQSGGGLPRRQNSLTWITNDGDQGAVYPFDVIATADELVFSNIDAVPTGLSRIMIRVLSQSHW